MRHFAVTGPLIMKQSTPIGIPPLSFMYPTLFVFTDHYV